MQGLTAPMDGPGSLPEELPTSLALMVQASARAVLEGAAAHSTQQPQPRQAPEDAMAALLAGAGAWRPACAPGLQGNWGAMQAMQAMRTGMRVLRWRPE